ncbi:hypothetical protein BaRGS_00038878, partial [Batillaria attramentaria]
MLTPSKHGISLQAQRSCNITANSADWKVSQGCLRSSEVAATSFPVLANGVWACGK